MGVAVVVGDLDPILAQARAFLQLHAAVEGAQFAEAQPLIIDLLVGRVANHDERLAAAGQPEIRVILSADHALEMHGLIGAVDGPVGGDVHADLLLPHPLADAKIPRTDAPPPAIADGDEGRRAGNDDRAPVAVQFQAGDAIGVRRDAANLPAPHLVDGQRQIGHRLAGRQVSRPNQRLIGAGLEREVEIGDDQNVARVVVVAIRGHIGRVALQQINARRQRPARRLGQIDGGVALLVLRRFQTLPPLAQQLRIRRKLLPPPVPILIRQNAVRQAIELEVDAVDVDVAQHELRGQRGVVGAHGVRNHQAIDRLQRAGAEAHGAPAPDRVAVGIGDAVVDAHGVIGRRLRAKLDVEGVVVGRPIGINLRGRERRRHIKIRHHGFRIDAGVKVDLETGMRRRISLTIGGGGPHDLRQWDGRERPGVAFDHPLAPCARGRRFDARSYLGDVGRVELQRARGRENQRLPFHSERASHPRTP